MRPDRARTIAAVEEGLAVAEKAVVEEDLAEAEKVVAREGMEAAEKVEGEEDLAAVAGAVIDRARRGIYH
jgi:uncharacterized protein (UPF0218 family)